MDQKDFIEEIQELMQEISKTTGVEEREGLIQNLINTYNNIINKAVNDNWQNYHRESDGRDFPNEIDIRNYVKENKLFQFGIMEEEERKQSTLDKIEKEQELITILQEEEERLQTTMEQLQKAIFTSTEELFGAHECPVEKMIKSNIRRTDFAQDDVIADIMSDIRKKVATFNQQTITEYQVSLTSLQHQLDDLIHDVAARDQSITSDVPLKEEKPNSSSFDVGALFAYEATQSTDMPTTNISELFDNPKEKEEIQPLNRTVEEPPIWDRILAHEESQQFIKDDMNAFLTTAGMDLKRVIEDIQRFNVPSSIYLQPECGVMVKQIDYPEYVKGDDKKVIISESLFEALTQTVKVLPDIQLYRYHDTQDDKDAFVILTEEEGKRLEMRNPNMKNHRFSGQSKTIESSKEHNPLESKKNAQEYDGLLW